ncbi:RidA family protein [Luteithermobacter gelatinilyticus]|uniref:RidA family protein n=1 Tax=Luteithermobacter gelatinilyticus TaxID=2582913 RepID=UPI0011059198|nr:RidA family protein [Luteithermobacter gelatinilyticus]|tara:strand:- start:224 stop:646 length:423 start_codon:yes stop_codon:yes gene_type:complete
MNKTGTKGKILLPPDWPRPKGYSNGIMCEGEMIFLAGTVGWNEKEEFPSDDLVDQFRQCLINITALLVEAGAGPEHVVRLTWYVTDMEEYRRRLPEIGAVYREYMGKNFPTMACVGVTALVEKEAKIEIETTAVLPRETA